MIKNILCGLMILGCVSGNCWGMMNSKTTDDLPHKKLIVYGEDSQSRPRSSSLPVTQDEKKEVEKIIKEKDNHIVDEVVEDQSDLEKNKNSNDETKISVSEFLKMPEDEAKQYKDVEFRDVKIDEAFLLNYNWRLNEFVNLSFSYCTCVDGLSYKDLFESTSVESLQVKSCKLTSDDVVCMVCNLYPWMVNSIVFENEDNIDKDLVIKEIKERSSFNVSIITFR